jgi:preprotein translocase subunit SecA
MANVGALTIGRAIEVNSGVYQERRDRDEHAAEEWLRGLFAKLPSLRTHRTRIKKLVAQAAQAEASLTPLTDAQLLERFKASGRTMHQVGFTDEALAHSMAIVREACKRSLGMRHHDVQIIGGWALLQGWVAEMATGEGKTLVAALSASAAASTGAAVHVVTVNDYLAERDAEQNAPLFKFLGLSIGIIKGDMDLNQRRAQYACDVVYVSNKELVFDYLKDRIATRGVLGSHLKLQTLSRMQSTGNAQAATASPVLLRGLHVAIVDEADSVLIDEARTPLIISETMPDEMGPELYNQALAFGKRMLQSTHFSMAADRQIWLNPQAETDLELWSQDLPGVWTSAIWRKELIQKALTALHCFQRDQHYILVDNKIQIVDEFTGRVMPDRSWERGLHQMIEAKESAEVTGQRKTLSQMTYQRFFRRYLLLCGMTGTAKEIAVELKSTYDLEVLRIPTHKPPLRMRLADSCYTTDALRWQAVAARAVAISQQGRPVLVGTRSVEASEKLSALLEQQGIAHTVLNARQDKTEAEAVAQGGEAGRITVATNMAGRGTDIKLAPGVNERGGLHVILTEFHESARVDRQLFGRSARQGNSGSAEAVVTTNDELFTRFAWPLNQLARKWSAQEASLPFWLLRGMVKLGQSRAERHNRHIRLDTVKQDKKRLDAMGFTGRQT